MALIKDFHVVATHYPVDPDSVPTFREGQFVMLNSSGYAVPHDGDSGHRAMGIAGDNTGLSTSDTNKAKAYSDQVVVNASGATLWTQNRVSDPSGNETLASGRLTVYNGGGEFVTDQYETLDGSSPITYVPGNGLYISANAKATTNNTSGTIVATVVAAPYAYPSGVPGTDTTDGSMSLGTFIRYKLDI